jgi:hypothetical protein
MSDVMIINQGYELRTSKSGKQRVTIVVKSEPVILNVDPKTLGQPIALAIAKHFQERIKGITAVAAPATIKARQAAAKAVSEGKAWAMKRYGGGRMGLRQPNQSDRLFNDSGKMWESITATASKDGAWRVNVAASRLNPETLTGGMAALGRIIQRLNDLVPEIQNPALLMQNDILKRVIKNATESAIKKAQARTTELRIEAAKRLFDLLRVGANVVRDIAA